MLKFVKTIIILSVIVASFSILVNIDSSHAMSSVSEYCQYSKQNGLPTPWEYHCYDEPLGNPQREMNLGKSAVIIDYKDCNVDDKLSCFEESFDDVCMPTTFTHVDKTCEGDLIFYDVFLKEDCSIHVVHDNRLDMYSSLDNRRITHTVCPNIELINNNIVLDSCNELQPFDDYYELFHIKKEKNESTIQEPEPYLDPDNVCPPEMVLDWDICIDKCRIGQIESNGICREINFNSIGSVLPYFVIAIISVFVVLVVIIGIIFVSKRTRK